MAKISPLLRASNSYLRQLDAQSDAALSNLLKRYEGVRRDLLALLDGLLSDMEALESPTPGQLYRLERYQRLLQQVMVQMGGMGRAMTDDVRQVMSEAARVGAEASIELGSLASNIPGALESFARLDAAGIARAASFVAPGSPLATMLTERYGQGWAEVIANQYVSGVALGWSPRRTVQALRQTVEVAAPADLSRIIRTAQLYAYRQTNISAWQQSGVVDYWIWHSALQPGRTCAACWAMHGTKHDMSESLDDHYNGLCLVAGSSIQTARGVLPIEAVRVGDYVLTHRSRYRRVTATSSRAYDGEVVTLTAKDASVSVTPEHRVLTQRGWVEARALSASDTLRIFVSCDERASRRNTDQPRAISAASLRASAGRFVGEWCQRGSSSTAIISSGNAKSILNVSTANCGTGINPALLNACSSARSIGEMIDSQCTCLPSARLRGPSGLLELARNASRKCGLRLRDTSKASDDVRTSMPFSRMSRMSGRRLMCNSLSIIAIDHSSSTYLRRNQSPTGSPSLSSRSASQWDDASAPTSSGVRTSPSLRARCCTDLTDFLSACAISLANNKGNNSVRRASCSGVQNLGCVSLCVMGTIVHRVWQNAMCRHYTGTVYDLSVEGDHSFVAGGIVVHNCAAVPHISASPDYQGEGIEVDTGEQVFSRLSPSEQERIATGAGWGPQYRAWQDGRISFGDMAGRSQDDVYGTMRVQASLKSLLGDEAAMYYAGGATD